MKVKYTMDRNALTSDKMRAVSEINSREGRYVTISGDVIEVETWKEKAVEDILKKYKIKYTRGKPPVII